MVLTCPRCGTDVPNEALYCPYCSLPKPKRGFAAVADAPTETALAAEEPKPVADKPRPAVQRPVSRKDANTNKDKPERQIRRSPARPAKPARNYRVSVLTVAALVAVLAVGTYIFVVPMVYSENAEPKVVLSALEKLRRMPSNEPEVTIDARLSRELETSRRVKNLVSYKGWTVHPIKGTKSKVVLAFSFEEVGGVQQSAEWLADLDNNTFTPQTELATSVSAK